jgi:hypothetical protein
MAAHPTRIDVIISCVVLFHACVYFPHLLRVSCTYAVATGAHADDLGRDQSGQESDGIQHASHHQTRTVKASFEANNRPIWFRRASRKRCTGGSTFLSTVARSPGRGTPLTSARRTRTRCLTPFETWTSMQAYGG